MNRKYVIRVQDIYIFIVGFWISSYMLHQTGFDDVLPISIMMKLARILCYVYFGYTLFKGKVKKKAFFLALFILGVSLLSFISSENMLIIDTLIIILSARKNNDVSNVVKKLSLLQICLIFITVGASFVGLISNTNYVRAVNGVVRQGLGFEYATYSANYFFHAAIAYVAFRNKKFKVKDLIVLEAVNIFLYYYTNTTAVFFELTVALVGFGLIQFIKKPIYEIKILKNFFKVVFPICTVLPIILTFKYDAGSSGWGALNVLLTNRLSIGLRALKQYPITLFGQVVQWYTGIGTTTSKVMQYIYVDSSYLNIAITYGIIVLIIVVVAYMVLMNKAIKDNNGLLCVALTILAVHSMTDPQLILLQYNVILIALVKVFSVNNENNMMPEYGKARI